MTIIEQNITNICGTYWLISSLYGAYWLSKNNSLKVNVEDEEQKTHFTLLDLLRNLFPSMFLSWLFIPIYLFSMIKFKKQDT